MSEPLTSSHLKNRLLGAALLVILAVLLIPLLLGEPKQASKEIVSPASSVEFKSIIQPLPEQSLASGQAQTESNSSGVVLKKINSINAERKVPTALTAMQAAQTQNNISSIAVELADESLKKQDKKQSKLTANTIAKQAKQGTAQTQNNIKSGWVVQAGIFSKHENATLTAIALKNKGYSPKVSETTASFGKATRVWLGPYSSKKEALALSNKIKKQTGNGGYVAPYPFKS